MKRFLLVSIFVMLLVACERDAVVDDVKPIYSEKIYAVMEDDQSRVQLNSLKQTTWSRNDQVVVLGNDEYSLWQFDGNDGDREGSFSKIGEADAGLTNYDQYYAIYPYSLFLGYSSRADDNVPALFVTFPSVQSYAEGSYDNNTNIMLGTSADMKSFRFRNMAGYLRLSLTGDKMVESIELSGCDDEAIAGGLYLFIDNPEQLYLYDQQPSTTITLKCDQGVMLSSTPKDFYFVMPPTKFMSGISVNIHFTDGSVYPLKSSKQVSVDRNTIQPMATIDVSGEVEWQYVRINHSGDEIYAPYIYGTSAVIGYIYWGDGEMSELNSYSSYVYAAGEQREVVVQSLNGEMFYIESCKGVTDIDFSDF